MTTTTATAAIKTLASELEEHHRSFTERAKDLIRPAFAEYFEKHPDVETVAWSQYTPYFMDGDECVFGVNSDEESIEINAVSFYDHEQYDTLRPTIGYRAEDGSWQSKTNEQFNEAEATKYTDASELIGAVPSDLMKAMFGDHIQVTAHRDGRIETDEYSHD